MKARPSLEKRRRELKLQEHQQEKIERRRLRKEGGVPGVEGDPATADGTVAIGPDGAPLLNPTPAANTLPTTETVPQKAD